MMKRILISVFTLCVMINLFADGVLPNGSGTDSDPYQIEILDNLLWISTNSNSWDKNFTQIADIDASDTQNWNNGFGFSPIGNFSGIYHGSNYIIHELYINHQDFPTGFFRSTSNSLIENVILHNANITGMRTTGGLIGVITNNSDVNNCFVTGTINGGDDIGGLAGFCSNSEVINCTSECLITGSGPRVGGLIGNIDFSTISLCNSICIINGNSYVGGLIGLTHDSDISFCSSSGDVIGEEYIGGLIGKSNQFSNISNCFSRSNVTGINVVGGFIGILATYSTIDKCYSTGFVDGLTNVGGFTGVISSLIILNSFWDIETSGQSTNFGLMGKTTAEMHDVATYTDVLGLLDDPWDFVGNPYDDLGNEDYWDINISINDGYPNLSNLFVGDVNNDIPYFSFNLNNYPNPFNPNTTIEFSIQNDSKVNLSIFNIKGQRIKILINNEFQKGSHSINWNGDDEFGKPVSSGNYYYKLNVNGKTEVVKK